MEINGCNGRNLAEMNIPKEEQEVFLENCRKSGEFCDCEIFLNSEEYLREIYNK